MFQKYHWYNLDLKKKAKWCGLASLVGVIAGAGFLMKFIPTQNPGASIALALVFVVVLQWYASKLRRQDMRESRKYIDNSRREKIG